MNGRSAFARRMDVTIVSGPPCAGKTTYVMAHAAERDIVIDLDRIASALMGGSAPDHGHPEHIRSLALAARDAVMARLTPDAPVWLIDTELTHKARRVASRVVTIDPGMDVCIERARSLRPAMLPVIARWYAEHAA